MANLRFFVEKKTGFDIEAKHLCKQFQQELHIIHLNNVRVLNCYDIFDIDTSEENIEKIKTSVLSEVVTDNLFDELDLSNKTYFAVEYLAGQFDQRADSAEQCIELVLSEKQDITIKSAKIIILDGDISQDDVNKIKNFYINPVECQEKDLTILEKPTVTINNHIEIYDDFLNLDNTQLDALKDKLNLSLSYEDFRFIQSYYKAENRCPTETEIKVFDTYWSDHCRHTTFETTINSVTFPDSEFGKQMQVAYQNYLDIKQQVAPKKKQSLMDMATVMGKYLRSIGKLDDLEISDENNACSKTKPIITQPKSSRLAVHQPV